jgi:hypothetical protein
VCAGLQDGPGRLGGPELAGRRRGDARLADGEQKPGRQRRRFEAARPQDDDQGQAAGDPEDGVLADAEADAAHPRAAGEGDGPAHEGDSGKCQADGPHALLRGVPHNFRGRSLRRARDHLQISSVATSPTRLFRNEADWVASRRRWEKKVKVRVEVRAFFPNELR